MFPITYVSEWQYSFRRDVVERDSNKNKSRREFFAAILVKMSQTAIKQTNALLQETFLNVTSDHEVAI